MRLFYFILFGLVPFFSFGASQLTADPPVCDMGTLFEGVKSNPIWVLRNDGDEPIRLKQIKSSCGCLELEYELKDLAPGEHLTVSGTWDTMGKLRWDPERKPTEIANTFTVISDASNSRMILKAKAMLTAHPAALFAQFSTRDIGNVPAFEPTQYEVTIFNDNDYPVQIQSLSPSEFEGMNPLGIGVKITDFPSEIGARQSGTLSVSVSWEGVEESEKLASFRSRKTQFHRYFKLVTLVPEKTEVTCESFIGIFWKIKPQVGG